MYELIKYYPILNMILNIINIFTFFPVLCATIFNIYLFK